MGSKNGRRRYTGGRRARGQNAIDRLKDYGLPEEGVKREAALVWLESHCRHIGNWSVKDYLVKNIELGRRHLEIAKKYGVVVDCTWMQGVTEIMAEIAIDKGDLKEAIDIAETHGLHRMVGEKLKLSQLKFTRRLDLTDCKSSNYNFNTTVFYVLIARRQMGDAVTFAEENGLTNIPEYALAKDIVDTLTQ